MPTRTLTGTIYHMNNEAWAGCQVRIKLMAQFTNTNQVVPVDQLDLIANASGQIAATLLVPSTGSAHYQITYGPFTLDTYIPDGGALTLDDLIAAPGSVPIAYDAKLVEWTSGENFEVLTATFDGDGVLDAATLKWPDGSAGAFTTVTKNNTHHLVDAYTVSHTVTGRVVTQALVTRNTAGQITAKPALTVGP